MPPVALQEDLCGLCLVQISSCGLLLVFTGQIGSLASVFTPFEVLHIHMHAHTHAQIKAGAYYSI